MELLKRLNENRHVAQRQVHKQHSKNVSCYNYTHISYELLYKHPISSHLTTLSIEHLEDAGRSIGKDKESNYILH